MVASKMRTRAPWWEFRPVLMQREAFQAYGALRGIVCDSEYVRANRGRLPDQFGKPMPIPDSIDYAVYSYGTPIAWHLAATDEWVVPSVRYLADHDAASEPHSDGSVHQLRRGRVVREDDCCPVCGTRLVIDDTSGRVYCEQNADHTPASAED